MKLVYSSIQKIFSGKLKHITRFSIVGLSNTIVDFTMFTMFNLVVGMSFSGSQVMGYSCGITNSFFLNRKWTFDDRHCSKKTVQELVQFIIVNLISLGITVLVMDFLIKNMSINVYVSKMIVTFVVQITNFIGYKLWVFNYV